MSENSTQVQTKLKNLRLKRLVKIDSKNEDYSVLINNNYLDDINQYCLKHSI